MKTLTTTAADMRKIEEPWVIREKNEVRKQKDRETRINNTTHDELLRIIINKLENFFPPTPVCLSKKHCIDIDITHNNKAIVKSVEQELRALGYTTTTTDYIVPHFTLERILTITWTSESNVWSRLWSWYSDVPIVFSSLYITADEMREREKTYLSAIFEYKLNNVNRSISNNIPMCTRVLVDIINYDYNIVKLVEQDLKNHGYNVNHHKEYYSGEYYDTLSKDYLVVSWQKDDDLSL